MGKDLFVKTFWSYLLLGFELIIKDPRSLGGCVDYGVGIQA